MIGQVISDIMSAIAPQALLGLAGLTSILVWLIVGNVRGWYVPGATHRREMDAANAVATQAREDRDAQVTAIRTEMTSRMEAFRADHAIRVEQARQDHEKQLAALVKVTEGVRADFAVILAKADRDIDQWRGAWQIADQATREEIGSQLEELVAFARTFARWMTEFQRQPGVPELPPSDRGRNG